MVKTITQQKKGATPAAPTTTTDWAIMLYIAADDVLANFAVESLKQLTKSFSTHSAVKDEVSVVVAAQFALPLDAVQPASANAEASGDESKRRYIFKEGNGRTLAANQVPPPASTNVSAKAKLSENPNLSEKEALKEFLQWAYANCKAEHYALILWGHGPELLFQPTPPNPTGDRNSLYLTPMQLRGALEDRRPPGRSRLDIVGFDACSMSMFEMAFELQGVADFMVASQDDVPDLSFPYDNLIELFRKDGNKAPASLLQGGVKAYVSAYQDCICNINTGMKPVTLSVLNLEKCEALKSAVGTLACALLKAKGEACLADQLINARKFSHDYAGGLYVDLHDFCTNLARQRKKLNAKDKRDDIQRACRNVLEALTKGTSNLILANSSNKRGHGVSIYLPYLTDGQYAEVSKPLVKGGHGTNGAKGFSDMLNGAATEYLMCARRELILDTESYYAGLELAETGWYDFIAELWTKALIKTAPAELDYHYSAQQSWMNITRGPVDVAKPCPAEASASPATKSAG